VIREQTEKKNRKQKMTSEVDDGVLPMRAVLQASDVVAAGGKANMLQVPSPIYTAEFTDAHHVLIGAGGGGRKFGMANIALLLRVQSLRNAETPQSASRVPTKSATPAPLSSSPSPNAAGTSFVESSVWSFAAAVDLGVDIPWCTSTFLPFVDGASTPGGSATDPAALRWSDKQLEVLQGLTGFIALSSITSFTLMGVYRGTEPTSNTAVPLFNSVAATCAEPAHTHQHDATSGKGERQGRYLRQLARITVPNDDKDPDKKPIAVAQNVLLVAHDSNGVHGYALTDLVPDGFEDDDEEHYCETYAAQLKPGGALQYRVPRVITTATPVAEWQLPARVNDLSVNRVCIVQAEHISAPAASSQSAATTTAQPCKAHLHEYLVLAAVLQNKTVALSTLRLRRSYGGRGKGADKRHRRDDDTATKAGGSAAPTSMYTTLTLTGAELPLPFKLLTSSLRLVRLFGWNNISAAQQVEMRRQLTWKSLQEKGIPTHGPLCSLMLVAFDTHTSQSYVIHGAVEVTPSTLPVSEEGGGSDSRGELTLSLRWTQLHPAPVLGDAITSLSVCVDNVPGDYEARLHRSPIGAAVPVHFVAGTVEGWVASIRWDAEERRWRSDHVRPSPIKSVVKQFPALHKEPVSCVAVSAENDVVSADIAQNVALTSMPYSLQASSTTSPSLGLSNGGAHRHGSSKEGELYVVQPRLSTASALFPASVSEAGLFRWVMEELVGGSVPMRTLLFLAVPLLLLFVGLIMMMR
jgi:hypothetical protein